MSTTQRLALNTVLTKGTILGLVNGGRLRDDAFSIPLGVPPETLFEVVETSTADIAAVVVRRLPPVEGWERRVLYKTRFCIPAGSDVPALPPPPTGD